jgi:hypothetical protein
MKSRTLNASRKTKLNHSLNDCTFVRDVLLAREHLNTLYIWIHRNFINSRWVRRDCRKNGASEKTTFHMSLVLNRRGNVKKKKLNAENETKPMTSRIYQKKKCSRADDVEYDDTNTISL